MPGKMKKGPVELLGSGSPNPREDLDTLPLQTLDPLPVDEGVRILTCDDHPGDLGSDDGFCTWGGLAKMIAGLKVDVKSCSPGPGTGFPEGLCFGMGLSRTTVPAFPQKAPVPNNHGPDHGVGVGPAPTTRGQPKRSFHEPAVFIF